ncbi:protein kinase, ATP binding site-containing protein, partial [Tanacetum coccineum]
MSPPPEVNLENLGISREQIDNVATNFKTGAVIKPGVYRYEGHLYEPDREDDGEDDREVVMFLEVDLKSRWKSSKSGFVYSDEFKILSMCRHKNILPFIGYYDDKDAFFQDGVDGDKVILVYEGYYGNLAEYLRKDNKKCNLSWAKRLKICIGIANGLNYLHLVLIPVNKLHAQINFDVQPEDNPDPIYHEIRLLDKTTDVYGILMFEILMWMVANDEK